MNTDETSSYMHQIFIDSKHASSFGKERCWRKFAGNSGIISMHIHIIVAINQLTLTNSTALGEKSHA